MKAWMGTLLLVLCTGLLTFGQSSVRGLVTTEERVEPLEGVHIGLVGSDRFEISDQYGYFQFNRLSAGEHQLVFSYVGSTPVTRKVILRENEDLQIEVNMKMFASDLKPVVIESSSITGGWDRVKSLPGSAHYISPLQLKKFSYTDINKSLRQIPGINMQEEDGFGLRPNIGLRGTGVERSSKITVMEDGVLAAPAPYSAPSAYYFPTTGRMHAIEVVKGSSQIKYGPFTTGGAINLISTPVPNDFNAYMHIAAGTYNSKEIHLAVGNSHDYVSYMVETFQYNSDGFKDLDSGDDTGFDKKDYLFKVQLHNKANAPISHKLQFKAGFAEEQSNETYLGLTQADFEESPYRRYSASQEDEMDTDHRQLSASYIIAKEKNFTIATTIYRNEFKRNWYKLDSFKDTSGVKTSISSALEDPSAEIYDLLNGNDVNGIYDLNVKANNREYTSEGVQSNINYKFGTYSIAHNVRVGIRFHKDEMDRFQWIDKYDINDRTMFLNAAGMPGTESNRVHSAEAVASYLQYQLSYGLFNITPGIRYENIVMKKLDYGKNDPDRMGTDLKESRNMTESWIPGISIDAQINESFFVFTGVHKGFSPAGSSEGTNPEESVNYEAGVRKTKGKLNGELIIFLNDYSNLIGSDFASSGGGGSGDQFNAGQAETMGVEFQIRNYWLLDGGLNGVIDAAIVYTFTDGHFSNSFESGFEGWEEVEKGDELPYMSKNQFTLFASYTLKGFSFNASARYQDEMRTVAGHGSIPDNYSTDQQFLIDLGAEYQINKNISVFGTVNNITDEEYIVARRPAGVRPGLPRFLKGGIRLVVN